MCEDPAPGSQPHEFVVGVDTEDCQACGKGRNDHVPKEEDGK